MHTIYLPICITIILVNHKLQVSSSSSHSDRNLSPYHVLYSWKSIDYKFSPQHLRNKLILTGNFIPENNVISGIKIHGNRIYLTTPRLRSGVPSTLNYIHLSSFNSFDKDKSPLLVPFPSWKMQRIGNCNALQFVMSMEIDTWGRMWIIDVGRENILGQNRKSSAYNCPAKLLIIDLFTNQVIHKHEFPESVVNHRTNFLDDIAVECKSDRWGCWAYITDSWDSKLVIYSLEEDRSWLVKNPSMEADPRATEMNILGSSYTFNMNINGIALSPKTLKNHDRLYFTPLSSYSVYSVNTSTLKQAFSQGQTILPDSAISLHIQNHPSQSGGIMMDSIGRLFMGQLQNNAVSYFNTTTITDTGSEIFRNETLLIQNDNDLQWPDTFGFDTKGYLYLVTCRMNQFFTDTLDFNDINFRVIRTFVGSRSYMY